LVIVNPILDAIAKETSRKPLRHRFELQSVARLGGVHSLCPLNLSVNYFLMYVRMVCVRYFTVCYVRRRCR